MRVLIHILHVATIHAMDRLANVPAISRDVQRSGPVNHYPDFLYPERDGLAELGKERRFHAGNDSIRIVTADGELWIFPDGHRLLLPRSQK